MVNIKIETTKKSYNIDLPQSWEEVPEHLYPSLARIFLRGPQYMNENDKLVRALAILMDEQLGALDLLDEGQLYEMTRLIYWVFEDVTFSSNKINGFDHDGQYYHGPSAEFSNLRFGEFVMAETYFMQYHESHQSNEALLNKLIAVLYRPLGEGVEFEPGSAVYRGDRRQRFNSNLIDDRAEKLKSMDMAVRDGILLWYAVTRDSVFKCFPNVFKRSAQAKKNNQGIDFGWLGVFDDLLGEKGRTAETLEDEFVSTVLMSLERAQIKNRERKK